MNKPFEVIGIGNAIVDVLTQCDDSFLDHMGIEKGIMQLVERDRAEQLYAAMDGRVQTPGGSVANTIAGAGALGLDAAFIGRVHDDALGRFYAYYQDAELTALLEEAGLSVETRNFGADEGLDGTLAPWMILTARKI